MDLLIIFLGHFAYGITNVLWKSPQEKIDSFLLIVFRSFGCLVIFSILYFFTTYSSFENFDVTNLLLAFLLCAVNSLGLIFYLKSLMYGNASKVVGLGKIHVIFGVIFSIFILKNDISYQKILLSFMIFVGVLLVDGSLKKSNGVRFSKAFYLTLLSRLFWATNLLFYDFIKEFGFLFFCVLLELAVFLVSLTVFFTQKRTINFSELKLKTINEVVFLIVLGSIGTLCAVYGISKVGIFVFAILALLEPCVSLIFSRFYYKESLTKLQILGIVISVVASIVLTQNYYKI